VNEYTIYAGWDSHEPVGYEVFKYSVLKHTKSNVEIIPLKQDQLRKDRLYWRPKDERASTEFSLTRFLVPILNRYKGWSVFCDGADMLFNADVKELFDLADSRYAVQVVKHDYVPKPDLKMGGQPQYPYPRKNWSSVILWNCDHDYNKCITREFVNHSAASVLHQFRWLPDDAIGELPLEWNWLVGEYEPTQTLPKNLHFTRGSLEFGPDHNNKDYDPIWKQYYKECFKKEWADKS